MGWATYMNLEAVDGKEPCNGEDTTKINERKEYVLAGSKHVAVRLGRALRFGLALPRWFAQRKDEATENDVAEKCETVNENITEARSAFDSAGEEPAIEPRHDEPYDPEDGPTKLAEVTRRLIGHGMAHGAQRDVDRKTRWIHPGEADTSFG